ncbi:MAG: hypothetical protein ABI698_04980 [bacterium]
MKRFFFVLALMATICLGGLAIESAAAQNSNSSTTMSGNMSNMNMSGRRHRRGHHRRHRRHRRHDMHKANGNHNM